VDVDLAGPGQPRPAGWWPHTHVHRFTVAAPRDQVWGWLCDPATFTDTQVGPFRDGEYRDLRYLYGAFAVSFRLLRPTRLQFRLTDAPGGTAVELQIDAHVRPLFLRPWELSQRLFWRRFETWTRRSVEVSLRPA
jgi:hypothetical protein